jgi:hypothetical protein
VAKPGRANESARSSDAPLGSPMIPPTSVVSSIAWATVSSAPSSAPPNATRAPSGFGGSSAGRRSKKGRRRGARDRLGGSVGVLSTASSRPHLGATGADPGPAGSLDPGSSRGDRGHHGRPAPGDADANHGLSPHRCGAVPPPAPAQDRRQAPHHLPMARRSMAASQSRTSWPVGPPSDSIWSDCLAMPRISIQWKGSGIT